MPEPSYDVVCVSHLRWRWVFQRPQHLLSRCARGRRVLYLEEPAVEDLPPEGSEGVEDGVMVVTPPAVPDDATREDVAALLRATLDEALARHRVERYVLWCYTPMAVPVTEHLRPLVTVYDCMDDLSAFNGAPPRLVEHERRLLERADLVFTGGRSLYEIKRAAHRNVHLFPSSVDVAHYRAARGPMPDPPDQARIPRPRLGWAGVIDERLDLDLLDAVAAARPEWQLVMVGPVVNKIDAAALPRRPNVHWLGLRSYAALPAYMAGWDVGLMPFARNRSTASISPTKTPEYLAAGLPVVSTPVRDVVTPYGDLGLVAVAADASAFVAAVEDALGRDRRAPRPDVDDFLARTSWDATWAAMERLVDAAVTGHDDATAPDGARTQEVVT